jgi:hypothetical protein
MIDLTIQVSDDLRDKVAQAAQHRGMALDEFIRLCLSSVVDRKSDPLFSDSAVFSGEVPSDLSQDHNDYLYGDNP